MHRRTRLSLAALLLIGLWGIACGEDPQPPANKVPVVTGPTVQSADVTSGTAVALTLEATDADGDSLSYAWVQTPATPAGTFSDAASASPTWTAPQVTTVTSFQLGVTVSDGREGTVRRSVTVRVRPAPPANQIPVIASGTPSASSTSVTGAVQVQLTLSASDADSDQLTYSWTQTPATPVGSFSSPSASNPTWTSPVVTTATRFTLKVTVSDGKGGTAQGQVEVDVAPPSNQNHAPVITAAPSTPTPTITSQQSANLTVSATDEDGDSLTYSWTQQSPATPAGSFSNATVFNPSWTAPTVTANTDFQLRVTVSDGKGGTTAGTVTVTVRPPNRNPTITQAAQASSTSVTGPVDVTLSVGASDPDSDPLTYAWTQTPATPAGTFSSATVSNPTWTSPVVTAATSFTLKVAISDGKGGSVQDQVSVNVDPPAPQNNQPTVGTPTANPTTLDWQQTTNLSVTASDPDSDPLTYAWTQLSPSTPAGTFSGTTSATPTWTAPRVTANTNFQLRVGVSDGRGGSGSGTVTVAVNAHTNASPTLTAGPSASATTVNKQQSTNLSVTATDAEGDPLSYAWVQIPATPAGTFSSTTSATPTWTAPTTAGTYTLRVTVSDDQGGSVQGTIDVSVVNRPPTVAATISGPTTLLAGDTGTFSITASDPDGDTLSYSWSQTDPSTQGTFMGSTSTSSAAWYSPALNTQTSFTLSVSVSDPDGQSTPVVRTVTLPVTVPRYTDVQSLWDTVPCTGCHGTSGGGLNLSASTSYGLLVDVPASAASPCNTLKRVDPNNPDNSLLIRKMEGTTCGNRMPRSDPTYFSVNPGLVVRVRSWILAGAPNN